MVDLPRDPADDPDFIDLAERVINPEAALVSAKLLHIVKIDSWFGPKWYSFAGKTLGALGIHSTRPLRVPPFHPHRVVSETRFRLSDPPVPVAFRYPFHTLRSSESSLSWVFGRVGRFSSAAWYSGGSGSSGRAAIMVYTAPLRGAVGWYVGFQRQDRWHVVKRVGIDQRHWLTLLDGQVGQQNPGCSLTGTPDASAIE